MLRIMKAPGARPAVGAAEHRTRSMRIVDAAQFRGGPVEGFVPRHRDELVATASRVRRRAALEPSAPDHRSRDACLVRHRGGNIAEERRGDRVARMRHDLEAAILDENRERAPMRAMRQAADLVHDPNLSCRAQNHNRRPGLPRWQCARNQVSCAATEKAEPDARYDIARYQPSLRERAHYRTF